MAKTSHIPLAASHFPGPGGRARLRLWVVQRGDMSDVRGAPVDLRRCHLVLARPGPSGAETLCPWIPAGSRSGKAPGAREMQCTGGGTGDKSVLTSRGVSCTLVFLTF